MLLTNSTYALTSLPEEANGQMIAANAEAFTRLAEPIFIVGILSHITGMSLLKTTMAPDSPGSIPILIIKFFQKVLQDMKVCGYNVLPIIQE
jgi:hypothetical protein